MQKSGNVKKYFMLFRFFFSSASDVFLTSRFFFSSSAVSLPIRSFFSSPTAVSLLSRFFFFPPAASLRPFLSSFAFPLPLPVRFRGSEKSAREAFASRALFGARAGYQCFLSFSSKSRIATAVRPAWKIRKNTPPTETDTPRDSQSMKNIRKISAAAPAMKNQRNLKLNLSK